MALLTSELLDIVRTVKELLPRCAESLDHLCASGNNQSANMTNGDRICVIYSDAITEKLDRARIIERELYRYNPRYKSQILAELQMLKDLNSR